MRLDIPKLEKYSLFAACTVIVEVVFADDGLGV